VATDADHKQIALEMDAAFARNVMKSKAERQSRQARQKT
jgi:hypothetical protein